MTLWITGCATNGLKQIEVIDYNCYMPHVVLIDRADVLVPSTKRQILFLNESWEAVCLKGKNDN